MKITIENEEFNIEKSVAKTILTEKAYKLACKIEKQGGKANFTVNAIREEVRNANS